MKAKYNFEDLYKEYYHYVAVVCANRVGSQNADDIAQEVFLKVWRYLDKFRGECHIRTWIHHIALNECKMLHRKHQRSQYHEIDLSEPLEDVVDIIKYQKPENENNIAIMQVVNAMPKGYKIHFILHHIEGYEHQEIAPALKESIGCSKSQTSRARLVMQEILTVKSNIKNIHGWPSRTFKNIRKENKAKEY